MDRGTGYEIHVERDQNEKFDQGKINRPHSLTLTHLFRTLLHQIYFNVFIHH